MQTLQSNRTDLKFRVISENLFDRPTVYKIIDEDGHMIAKINGAHNVPIVEKMVHSLNNRVELQNLCRNRLIEILKQLKGSPGSIQATCRMFCETKFEGVLQMLKDQLNDAPVQLISTIGGEAVQIIKAL